MFDSNTWAALLGAVVGGAFTLVGVLITEVRRDRRRRLAAARLILNQLVWSRNDLVNLKYDAEGNEGWVDGPGDWIQTAAWDLHAVDLLGQLDPEKFDEVDSLHHELGLGNATGFTEQGCERLLERCSSAAFTIRALSHPTWVDRHVWRL